MSHWTHAYIGADNLGVWHTDKNCPTIIGPLRLEVIGVGDFPSYLCYHC